MNVFVKPNDQNETCFSFGMARKGRKKFNVFVKPEEQSVYILPWREKGRMKYNLNITYTKAVGIILMVLCHAMFWDIPFVYMFHMPLFFFVSGYCFKERYLQEPFKFVWQRIKGIYWPYIKWSLLFLLLHNVFFSLNIYNGEYGYNGSVSHLYTQIDFTNRLESVLISMSGHEQLLGGYWFLKSLFWGNIVSFAIILISNFVCRKCKLNYNMTLLIGGGALLCMCLILNELSRMLTSLKIGPTEFLASVFFLLGHLFQTSEIPKFNICKIIFSFLLVLIGSFVWEMGMANVIYDSSLKILPYIVTGILGSWSIYSMPWNRLNENISNVLCFIGKNTLTILTWHFLSFKLVSLFIIYIYDLPIERLAEHPVIIEYSAKGWWIVYFIVSMTICSAIAYCNKYIKSSWLKL